MNNTKMTVGKQLGLGFALVLSLLVTISALGIWRLSQIEEHLEKIVNTNVHKLKLVNVMSESVHIISRVTRTIVLLSDSTEISQEMQKIENARKAYDDAATALEKMPAGEAALAIRTKARNALEIVRPLNNKVIELAKENKDTEATELIVKQTGPAIVKWQEALDENIAIQEENNKKDADEADEAYRSGLIMMLVLSGLAIAVGCVAAVVITRSLLRQLGGEPGYAAAVAGRIASGDLTVDVALRDGDQTSLLHAMKAMRDSLVEIVGTVRKGTDTIAAGSAQIVAGNVDLSSRTEQQASSLEETASSMEELTSTVKQNADNARQANAMAATASGIASKGGAMVAEVVETMASINESSKKVVDIIGVIDGIAFQTNILALNAAVEAARAGEQGRGFAVVASEVRNLAQRSAAAAKEIKSLIGNSVEKVEVGTRLVDQAGATMQDIVDSVNRVTDIISEIAAASQEQTSGIEQINQAITQMDQVTQQNASLVEEASAASESMLEQSRKLAEIVSVFKLNNTAASLTRAVPKIARSALKPDSSVTPQSKAVASPTLRKSVPIAAGDEWSEF